MSRRALVVTAALGLCGCQRFTAPEARLDSVASTAAVCGRESLSFVATGAGFIGLPDDALSSATVARGPQRAFLSGPAEVPLALGQLTSTRLELSAPDTSAPRAAGSYDLTIVLADGRAVRKTGVLTVHPTAVITSVAYEGGRASDRTATPICIGLTRQVRVKGSGFLGSRAPAVFLGSTSAQLVSSSDTELFVEGVPAITAQTDITAGIVSVVDGNQCPAVAAPGLDLGHAIPNRSNCAPGDMTLWGPSVLDGGADPEVWVYLPKSPWNPALYFSFDATNLEATVLAPLASGGARRTLPATVVEVDGGMARVRLPLCTGVGGAACAGGVAEGGPYTLRLEQPAQELFGSGIYATVQFSVGRKVRADPLPALLPAGTTSITLTGADLSGATPTVSALYPVLAANPQNSYYLRGAASVCPLAATSAASGVTVRVSPGAGCTAVDRRGQPVTAAKPVGGTLEGLRALRVSLPGRAPIDLPVAVASTVPTSRSPSDPASFSEYLPVLISPQVSGGLLYGAVVDASSPTRINVARADPLFGPSVLGTVTSPVSDAYASATLAAYEDPSGKRWLYLTSTTYSSTKIFLGQLTAPIDPPQDLRLAGSSGADGLAEFQVTALDASGSESAASEPAEAWSLGALSLQWSCLPGAAGYHVYRRAGARDGWRRVDAAPISGPGCPLVSYAYTPPAGGAAPGVKASTPIPGAPFGWRLVGSLDAPPAELAVSAGSLVALLSSFPAQPLTAARINADGSLGSFATIPLGESMYGHFQRMTAANGPVAAGREFLLLAGVNLSQRRMAVGLDLTQSPPASAVLLPPSGSGFYHPLGGLFADGVLWWAGFGDTLCTSCPVDKLAGFSLQPFPLASTFDTLDPPSHQAAGGVVIGRTQYLPTTQVDF